MRARPRTLFAALATAAAAAGLSGCVSVLPKADPAQLYTFGRGDGAAAATPAASAQAAPAFGQRTGVLLAAVAFPRGAQGDQILTMTGAQAAYIAESRWIAPAAVLFREAVERRFDAQAQRTRLVARGDLGRTSLILRLDVREFEATYPAPEAVPTVAVSVRARLTGPDGSPLDERVFESRRPAAENRVGAIVAAFDEAADEVLGGLVAWTDEAAARAPAAATSTTTTTTTTTTTAGPAAR